MDMWVQEYIDRHSQHANDINMSYYKSTPKSLDVLPTTYHRYITNDSTIEYVRSYINSNIREKYLVIRTCNTADVSILKLKPESDDELSFYELKQIINQIPMSFTLTTQEFRVLLVRQSVD